MKKSFKISIIIIVGIVALIATQYGLSYAKYAYNSVWNYYLKSKKFYFDSDSLGVDIKTHVDKLWNGDKVYFNIRNSLNDLEISESDIEYKVTCEVKNSSNNAVCDLMDTGTNTYTGVLSTYKKCVNKTGDNVDVSSFDRSTCEISGYEWDISVANRELYFTLLSDSGEVETADVVITVVSTSPYKKTLKGEYILNRDKNMLGRIMHDYNDFGLEGQLVLTNTFSEAKCLMISFDSTKLVVDHNDKKIKKYATDSDGYINEIVVMVDGVSSEIIPFYDRVLNDYSKDHFTIVESNEC